MACSCQKNREQFTVVLDGGNGRQVYSGSSKHTALKVSEKYPGSVVKDKGGSIVPQSAPAPAPAAKPSGPGNEKTG